MTLNLFSGTNDHRTLNHVAEFTHVAGPRVKLQRIQRGRTQKTRRPIVLFCELSDQMLGQQGKIFFSFTKRRQIDAEDVEAVEQITAKLSFTDSLAVVIDS